jgi:chromosomal replication initiator protein
LTRAPLPSGGLWAEACHRLRAQIGDANVDTWLAAVRFRRDGDEVTLEAPERTTRERVERHFLRPVEDALASVLGVRCAVRVTLATPPPLLPIRSRPPVPGQTFARFVVGESNRAACSAARALGAGPRPAPLFLHGPSGVGKTHLLHAIAHACEERGALAACLPAAHLVEAIVGATGGREHGGFWDALRPLRALLVDDVHSLAGQETLQGRLLGGLAGWACDGRLLVLTSDRGRDDASALVARMRSAFSNAVVAAIEPPEPALRLAILQQKARAEGLELPAALAARMAVALGGSVRRLEGALTRLHAHVRFGRPLDEALVHEVLPELRPEHDVPLDLEHIIAATATVFRLPPRRLRGRSRAADVLLARQVAMYLGRTLLGRPLAELGTAFQRDHTTVLHAARAIAARLASDARLARLVDDIERRLGTGTR